MTASPDVRSAEALKLLKQCGYDDTQVHPECYRNFSWLEFVRASQAQNEKLVRLLARCQKSVSGGKYRDSAQLSAEAHPVWDDVRAVLDSHQQHALDGLV